MSRIKNSKNAYSLLLYLIFFFTVSCCSTTHTLEYNCNDSSYRALFSGNIDTNIVITKVTFRGFRDTVFLSLNGEAYQKIELGVGYISIVDFYADFLSQNTVWIKLLHPNCKFKLCIPLQRGYKNLSIIYEGKKSMDTFTLVYHQSLVDE